MLKSMIKLFNIDGFWKKITNGMKAHFALIVLLLCSFGFRFYGIYFDYPRTNFIWDETYDMSYLMNLLEEKKLFSDNFTSSYPLLLPFLYFPITLLRMIYIALINGLDSASAFKNHVIEYGIGEIYIVSRWYAVFFGTATVLLIYKIYRYIFNHKLSAYYAALAYTFSLIPVFLSHWGKHHSAMVFFFTLSLFFILKFEQSKKQKFFYLSALAAALSFSTHYIGISAAIFPFCGYIFNRQILNLKLFLKGLSLYSGVALFFYLLNYKGVLWMFRDVTVNYYGKNNYSGILPTGALERFYYVFRDSFMLEPIFVSLFAVLIIFGLKKLIKNKLTRYVLAGLAFNYFLMITIIVGPRMTRWFLIFITLSTPLAAGYFAEYLLSKKIKKIAVYFALALMLIPSIFFSVRWLMILRHNTYVEAGEWIEGNVAKDQIVYSFDNVLYAPLSYKAAVWNRDFNKMTELKKNNYIIENKEHFQSLGVNLMYDKNNGRYKDLAGPNTKYILVSSEAKTDIPNVEKFHKLELVKAFKPVDDIEIEERGLDTDYLNSPDNWKGILKLEKSGPFIYIYKIL